MRAALRLAAAAFGGWLAGASASAAEARFPTGIAQTPAAPRRPAPEPSQGLPRGFDFYVLSLSWSPSYCEVEGDRADRTQCGGRPYAFVVHGLWPQFERGFPQDCATDQPSVPRELAASLLDIMPAIGLIRHEWLTHGTCAGLSQRDYFSVLRAARARISVPGEFQRLPAYRTVDPDAVEQSFRRVNPGMSANGLAVTCDRRFLREVRICLTKELAFRSCPQVDRQQCGLDRAVMPPVRGG